jgi:hypothetical protein
MAKYQFKEGETFRLPKAHFGNWAPVKCHVISIIHGKYVVKKRWFYEMQDCSTLSFNVTSYAEAANLKLNL